MADDKNRDKPLPKGWRKEVVQRKSGTSAGKFDTYIFSPDNTKFRSKVEIAAYLKQNKLSLSADDFSFARSADSSTPKAAKSGKDDEHSAKKPRGRSSGTPGKLLVKMPFSDKKATDSDKKSAKKKSATPGRKTAKEKTVTSEIDDIEADLLAIEAGDKAAAMEAAEVSEERKPPAPKKSRAKAKAEPEPVTNVDENTADYCEQINADTGKTAVDNVGADAGLLASAANDAHFLLFGSEVEGFKQVHNEPAAHQAEGSSKRIRTPKLFPDEIPTLEERRQSLEDPNKIGRSSATKRESEVEGSKKKKGGRPKKVEQTLEAQFDPFAKRFSPFDNLPMHTTPVAKPKKADAKKRHMDFESDLDLIAQHDDYDQDLIMDLPVPKKERKSAGGGGGRSSWGEIRHSETPLDVDKLEREAKKERERGKFFDPVIMTGRRERKKSSWMNEDWVDPDSITALQTGGGGNAGRERDYDPDEFVPRGGGGGGGRGSGRKKMEKFSYDKAKEESVLADLYGMYRDTGTMVQPRGHHRGSSGSGGRKSFDVDDDMGGSALRMHLSQPSSSTHVMASHIDELFIAEQSMKNRDTPGRLSSAGAFRKVGNSFLSKALGERKERPMQDEVPPSICPHPSDDHAYSSLVVRQQQLGDAMLDDEDTEDFGDSSDILLHGTGDEMKLMVAPGVVALPNGGRHHQQQQYILPLHASADTSQHVEKVAVQFLPISSVDNGFPTAVLGNGLGQTGSYRTSLADDVSGTSVGESLPLVLMEDDVLERMDASASGELKSPSHAAGRLATATR